MKDGKMTDIEALEDAIELLTKLHLDGELLVAQCDSDLTKIIENLNSINYAAKLKLRIDNHVRP